ncbi:unnamed protein product [Bursaphelenchus xylophilus]|uniref:(pine wood nematode) hypothetical protein n=1 Tax=Bursaphelenchus xylophilus TaxID=6326 RepID=A0A7I8XR55_BURXY|nr:unnamed protein product [Bursaphelenchus xylophilus]CAG9087594.1 unnamed protein product [Bursaphelenchus xylophilus]
MFILELRHLKQLEEVKKIFTWSKEHIRWKWMAIGLKHKCGSLEDTVLELPKLSELIHLRLVLERLKR